MAETLPDSLSHWPYTEEAKGNQASLRDVPEENRSSVQPPHTKTASDLPANWKAMHANPSGPPVTIGRLPTDWRRPHALVEKMDHAADDMLHLTSAQELCGSSLLPSAPPVALCAPDPKKTPPSTHSGVLHTVLGQLRYLTHIVEDELQTADYARPPATVSKKAMLHSSVSHATISSRMQGGRPSDGQANVLIKRSMDGRQSRRSSACSACSSPRSPRWNSMCSALEDGGAGVARPSTLREPLTVSDMFARLDKRGNGNLSADDCWKMIPFSDEAPDFDDVSNLIMHLNRIRPGGSSSNPVRDPGIDFETFVFLMTDDTRMPPELGLDREFETLRQALRLHAEARSRKHSVVSGHHSHHHHHVHIATRAASDLASAVSSARTSATILRSKSFKAAGLVYDTVPAVMILINALIIGIEADNGESVPEFWETCEMFFLVFFTAEFLSKIYREGFRQVMYGPDKGWNYFDCFCLFTAFLDRSITYTNRALGGGGVKLDGLMLIKMLRLARLARLIRLLRFKIFHELKMMVQGVVSGVRVLLWAIVLLFVCIFILGIVMRILVGDQHEEFSTMEASMFTLFRCFTDGCTAYNGTPLQERLRVSLGPSMGFVWVVGYMMVILFVTIGIFNLIMAIFIDNVVTAHIQRKQQQLGENASQIQQKIGEVISRRLIKETKKRSVELSSDDQSHAVITRDVFNTWLTDADILDLLEEAEVETSTKYELFDALDVDAGGELTIEELTDGLMKLRGPISKNDIVATRLKVAYLTGLVEEICNQLGIVLSHAAPNFMSSGA